VTHQRRLGWLRSLRNSREPIELVLGGSPSLWRELPDCLAWAYPKARRAAAEEPGLPLATFPERCPWNLDQLQDDDFLPERLA
jgi:hypothetical protein